jgi:hypothetical protein
MKKAKPRTAPASHNGGEVVEIDVDDLSSNRFLRKEQIPPEGLELTIDHLELVNVAPLDEPPEDKYIIVWKEDVPPMVLNKTNALALQEITGSRNSKGWIGVKVLVVNDLSVVFQGKRGGSRIRPINKLLRKFWPHPPVPMTQATGGKTLDEINAELSAESP